MNLPKLASVLSFAVFAIGATTTAIAGKAAPKVLPPAGIVPTTVTLREILEKHDAAVGQLVPGTPDTRREVWKITDNGFEGEETLVRSGLDYHSVIHSGPFVEEYGQLAGKRWHRFASGAVSPVEDKDYGSFEMLRVLEDAADPKNDVKLLGQVDSPVAAYVVEVRRSDDDRPLWIFYDRTTWLIVRSEIAVNNERIASTYGDYRTTKGLTQPWSVSDHSASGYEFAYQRTSMVVGNPVTPAELAVPSDDNQEVTYHGHVRIPGRILDDGTLIVRVEVNGRGLDFELSSGASESLIDRSVARELNLPNFGQKITAPDGSDVGYRSRIAAAKIGDVSLTNMIVDVRHFNYQASKYTQVVGVLGYDILRSGAFKIDYINGFVDLYDESTFSTMTPVPDSLTVPLTFEDGLALFSGTIASHPTKRLLLDNDIDYSLVLGYFTNKYPEAVRDQFGDTRVSTVVPFADSRSYGRAADVWRTVLPDFGFGDALFRQYTMYATNIDFFPRQHVDAIIGMNVLGFYDVYLDYPNNRAYLKPNDSFRKTFRPGK